MTEAAIKQHLLRLYQKLHIAEGPNRRVRLANEVVAIGLVRPLPAAEPPGTEPPGLGQQARAQPAEPGRAPSQLAS